MSVCMTLTKANVHLLPLLPHLLLLPPDTVAHVVTVNPQIIWLKNILQSTCYTCGKVGCLSKICRCAQTHVRKIAITELTMLHMTSPVEDQTAMQAPVEEVGCTHAFVHKV